MTSGFDSLVDELMACHGYDRDEAELVATARLAGVPEAAVKRAAEAFECKPCECGGHPECPDCGDA